MPLSANELTGLPDVRVHILNTQGQYLAADDKELYFTDDRLRAIVLSYEADHVAEQIETLHRVQGIVLRAVPVPLEEIYEACDRCNELFMPFMTFFDGKLFLCGECRRLVLRRLEGRRVPKA